MRCNTSTPQGVARATCRGGLAKLRLQRPELALGAEGARGELLGSREVFVCCCSVRATLDARCFSIGFCLRGKVNGQMRVTEGNLPLGVKLVSKLYEGLGMDPRPLRVASSWLVGMVRVEMTVCTYCYHRRRRPRASCGGRWGCSHSKQLID